MNRQEPIVFLDFQFHFNFNWISLIIYLTITEIGYLKFCFFILHLQPIDLSPGDLLYYGGVEWLNISDFLGKIKKGLELHAMCFVFKSAVVFLCKERLRQKKKLMVIEKVEITFFLTQKNP